MKREFVLFIRDIEEAIKSIMKFVEDMDFNAFCEDEKTQSAVVWKIATIGEAAKNIPPYVRTKYKDIASNLKARCADPQTLFAISYEL